MQLVYPPEGYETFESSTFLLGSVPEKSAITVNGESVSTNKSGFFAHKVSLIPGLNRFEIKIDSAEDSEHLTRNILYKKPLMLDKPHENPEEIVHLVFPHEIVTPQEDMGVQAGESVILVCPAPRDARVECLVDTLMDDPVEMVISPVPIDTRSAVFGQLHQVNCPYPDGELFVYEVFLPIDCPSLPNLSVEYTIFYDDKELAFQALGSLTVLPFDEGQYAKIKNPDVQAYTDAKNGTRKSPLLQGTMVKIIGFSGQRFRIETSTNESVWVQESDLDLMQEIAFPPTQDLQTIQVKVDPKGFILEIPLISPPLLEYDLQEKQIRLSLYNVVSRCDFIHYGPGVFQHGLEQIIWDHPSDVTTLITITLDEPLLGFSREYDAENKVLRCHVKTESALKRGGDSFVLILDPGHGGVETGATAPDGTPERQLNLQVALKLQAALHQTPNLNVLLTRTDDISLSLPDRTAFAKENHGDLFLSFHHNALPDGRDPLREKGVSSYYYHPFALPFAKRLQAQLVQHTEFDDYGILYDNLFVCRQPDMPSILLELGFLTYPDDATLCQDSHHQDKVVKALAQTILSYLSHISR